MVHWRGTFANCTHVIVSLLNLEGDCHMDSATMPSFNTLSRRFTPENKRNIDHQLLSASQHSSLYLPNLIYLILIVAKALLLITLITTIHNIVLIYIYCV